MYEIQNVYAEKERNIKLTFNFGSSGALQQQIEQGAPCDLFISAGKTQMATLNNKGLLLENTNKDLVKNSLVLIAPANTTIKSIADLKSHNVKNIAVGEPSSVPAGKYADESLVKLGLKASVSSKLVFAKDVKEVLAWATSGNAEVGFVYLSDTVNNTTIKVIETIPDNLHSPITYPTAVIKASKNINAAKDFEDFLFSEEAQKILEKSGFTLLN